MATKLFKTKGIVLRTVKYGETSLVVTMFTELFGIQSYLVNGVRTSTKKGSGKANLFQPAALLDLVVYHQENKHLHRLKEFHWDHLYEGIFSDVTKNAIALYMIELLTKCLRQPEENAPLFQFTEDCLLALDQSEPSIRANMALFFSLHLAYFFGISPRVVAEGEPYYFDMKESVIDSSLPTHPLVAEGKAVEYCVDLLRARQPAELGQIKMNQDSRRQILQIMEQYYQLHIQDFTGLKTLPVLRAILQ
jgi:DNA repair protein RecO (recombination protein O)